MKTQLIAAVTALALALTGMTASPVQAADKGDEALKVLLGAAAIGLLVNELSKNDKKKKAQQQAAQTRRWDDWDDWDDDDWRRDRRWKRDRFIPSQCVFPIRGDHGRREVVSARCLREFGVSRHVPDRCAFEIRTRRGRETVYGARCLAERGFFIGDWRRHGRNDPN